MMAISGHCHVAAFCNSSPVSRLVAGADQASDDHALSDTKESEHVTAALSHTNRSRFCQAYARCMLPILHFKPAKLQEQTGSMDNRVQRACRHFVWPDI